MIPKINLVLIFGLLAMLGWGFRPSQKVVFLDAGQGDSILLQDGPRQVLVDGGPGMAVLERLGEEMPWFDRHIEVVVLTHPQRDHMEGLMHVLRRYSVGMILLPKVSTPTLMQEKWLNEIIEQGVPCRFAWAGQKIKAGDIELSVLGPFDDNSINVAGGDVNDASVIVRADLRGLSWLLTGDAEKAVEKKLVSNWDSGMLDVDVLKAGHHGSKTSNTQGLVDAVSPSAAVISVGADNRFGHPSLEVLERFKEIPVWRTDESGSIGFRRWRERWYVTRGRLNSKVVALRK